jgi:hypothetical protein
MYIGIVLMCIDCVLTSPRIAQADPGWRTPPRGGSVIKKSLFQELVPRVEVILVSKFHSIWSTIALPKPSTRLCPSLPDFVQKSQTLFEIPGLCPL